MQNINKSLRYHLVAMTERLSPGLPPIVNQTLDKDMDNKRGSTAAPEVRLTREREPSHCRLSPPAPSGPLQWSTGPAEHGGLAALQRQRSGRGGRRLQDFMGRSTDRRKHRRGPLEALTDSTHGLRRASGRNWGATLAPTARGMSLGPANTAPSGDPWGRHRSRELTRPW